MNIHPTTGSSRDLPRQKLLDAGPYFTFTLRPPFLNTLKIRSLIMECQYTSCNVTCHRCGHAWTYMGSRLSSLSRTRKPVRVGCPRCYAKVALLAGAAQ
jgi:hypothetical protein